MKLTFKKILESLNLEARANPDLNPKETFHSFIENLLTKVNYENLYVSFRSSMHTTDINPKNNYQTPTGVYAYPVISYILSTDELLKMDENVFRTKFPYQSSQPFMQFIHIKDESKLLTKDTPKTKLDEYVKKIQELYGNIQPVNNLCNLFLNNKYRSPYINPLHETHKFWLFLYSIAPYINKGGAKETTITNICHKIGVDGFIDKYGDGYIHSAEKKQAVFFRIKPIADTYIYERPDEKRYQIIYTSNKKYFFFMKYGSTYTVMINAETKKAVKKIPVELLGSRFMYGFIRVRNPITGEKNFMREDGTFLSNTFYLDMEAPSGDPTIIVTRKDGRRNIMDLNGNILLPEFTEYLRQRNNFYLISTKDYGVDKNVFDIYTLDGVKTLSNVIGTETSFVSYTSRAVLSNLKQQLITNDGYPLTELTFDYIDIDDIQELNGWWNPYKYLFLVEDKDKGFNILTDTGKLLSPIWSALTIRFRTNENNRMTAIIKDPQTGLFNEINDQGELKHETWSKDNNFKINEEINRIKSIMGINETIQYHGQLSNDDYNWLKQTGRKSYSGGELTPIILNNTLVGGIHYSKMSGIWGIDYIEIKPEFRNQGILRKIIYDQAENGVVNFISANPELQQKLTTYGQVTTNPETDITTLTLK